MCRLPLDLMRQIIELVKQPLPEANDPKVTWKDLNQADLVSLMRASRVRENQPALLIVRYKLIIQMTYFIAAPLLYKEVVVNNLSSFFLGIDAPIRSHHNTCYVRPSDQRRICQWIQKGNGATYCCPAHASESSLIKSAGEKAFLALQAPLSTYVLGTYHKLELLEMVGAFHLVYGHQDRAIFSRLNIQDYLDGEELDKDILNHVDLRRYTDLPPCLKRELNTSGLLPKLRRFTIAAWLLTDVWDAQFPREARGFHLQDCEASRGLEQLRETLAAVIPCFAATFACRQACSGFFEEYTNIENYPMVNTLHDPMPFAFGRFLAVGANNTIHVEQWQDDETPLARFTDLVFMFAGEVSDAINRWHDLYDGTPPQLLKCTSFTFVLHREWGYPWDSVSAKDAKIDADILDGLTALYRAAMDIGEDGMMEFWADRCYIIWEEDDPGCPACRLGDMAIGALEEEYCGVRRGIEADVSDSEPE